MITNQSNYAVCFGEVLWDIFPSGSRAGGAPFNVAYNLFKMGIDTKMLSRIGNDQLGHQLLNQIEDWGITTDFIQIDQEKATGTVLADFDEHGEAKYDIVQEVAWDYIRTLPEHKELIQHSEAFVFGVWLQGVKLPKIRCWNFWSIQNSGFLMSISVLLLSILNSSKNYCIKLTLLK